MEGWSGKKTEKTGGKRKMKRKFLAAKFITVMAVAMVLTGTNTISVLAALKEETFEVSEKKPLPTEFAHIFTCAVEGDNQIAIRGQMEGSWSDPFFYDNSLYLFELLPYEDHLEGRTDYCGQITKGEELSFTVPLNLGTDKSRLYSKFVVAVFDGAEYKQISNAVYLTNPEAVGKNPEPYPTARSKKGLLIEPKESMLSDAFELGVNHGIVNITCDFIMGQGIDYVCDGKTYSFSKSAMEHLDQIIGAMTQENVIVTAVILNKWNDNTPQLFYPGARKHPEDQVFYYGFHASTKEGYETIKAVASFLADRYGRTNSMHGKISNWIIGNEINNQQWNYMGGMNVDQYVQEYERAFRVFYTAIRSRNQNDRLFFSIDFNWNQGADDKTRYNGKDIVDKMAERTRVGGVLDWGLAYHPYAIPLTEPEFWDDDQTGLITYDSVSPVINLKNLDVLTNYMQDSSLLDGSGNVRPIILSEQGFTSVSPTRGQNDDLQAAAIAYAYYVADSNPYIDAFIMSRQVDAPSEAEYFQNFGLWECDRNQPYDIVPTTRKKSWSVYKDIDDSNISLETTQFAKPIIGIERWSDVIPNFRWSGKE